MAEIPEWRKKVERRGEERRDGEREKAEERGGGEERKDPATVRYFLIDVDIWKTLQRTSMHRDNAMCLAYLEGASCIARFIASSFSTSSSIFSPRIGSRSDDTTTDGPTFRLKRLAPLFEINSR